MHQTNGKIAAELQNPFGMLMSSRSFSIQTRYRYGFNTQENDIELGQDIYSAEFWEYDAKLGRRWNLDPVIQSSKSNYLVLSNSPIIRMDPNGDLDYYTKRGKWIGSDGKDDGKKMIAYKFRAKNEIKKNSRNFGYTSFDEIKNKGVVELPDVKTKDAMNKSFADTKSDTKRYSSSDANQHEEGGFSDNTGPHEAKPGAGIGKDPTLPEGAGAGVRVGDSEDGTYPNINKIKFWWHTHPSGEGSGLVLDPEGPSDLGENNGDIALAKSIPKAIHIVFSTVTDRAFFYNGDGTYLTMEVKTFNNIIDSKCDKRKNDWLKKKNKKEEEERSKLPIDPVLLKEALYYKK